MNYVVTDRSESAFLLETLLVPPFFPNIRIVQGDGRPKAEYLARSLAAVHLNPVALVLDAEHCYDRQGTEWYMSRLAHPYLWRVFLVAPEIEVLFFHLPSIVSRLQTPELQQQAHACPRRLLYDLYGESTPALSDTDIQAAQDTPLLHDLQDFFSSWAKKTENRNKPR